MKMHIRYIRMNKGRYKSMINNISLRAMFCLVIVTLCAGLAGCGIENNRLADDETAVLVATISEWNEFGGDDAEPQELVRVKKGDVIFEKYNYKLVVKSVSSEKIVIGSTGGIVEKEKGGGINLNSKAPKTITINKGEEKCFATQSMDGGVNFVFRYEIR